MTDRESRWIVVVASVNCRLARPAAFSQLRSVSSVVICLYRLDTDLAGGPMEPKTIRAIGLAVISLAAGSVALIPTSARWDPPSPVEYNESSAASAASSALSEARVNEASATGAPQQAVVNGWAARDLLAAIAIDAGEARDEQIATARFERDWAEALRKYNAELAREQDQRVRRLLALVVAAIAWTGATLGWERQRVVTLPSRSAATDMPPPSGPPAYVAPPPFGAA